MSDRNIAVQFFFNLSKTYAIANRRFDNSLGGLGFNELIILYHLDQAENKSLRRIDLAEKIGFTASGVTRILLPMEKVGYVKKEINKEDARVSLVLLAAGGRRRLEEASERMQFLMEEKFTTSNLKKMQELTTLLDEAGQTLR